MKFRTITLDHQCLKWYSDLGLIETIDIIHQAKTYSYCMFVRKLLLKEYTSKIH